MKIVTVIGARPQFIKAAVVSRAVAEHQGGTGSLREVIVHTGQHYDRNMSDVFFEEMNIPKPDYLLDIHGLSHGAMTGQMLERVEKILIDEKPGMVLVYGDTNTTLAGALAAVKLHIPVAHVEAGLRSFNRAMPEEINRVMTDHVSTLLFCPTRAAVDNLKAEGITNGIHVVGDVMQDAALFYAPRAMGRSAFLKDTGLREFVLATVHRAENTDDERRLAGIMEGLRCLSGERPVVFPVHPRTRQKLAVMGWRAPAKDLYLLDPVGYFEMIELLQACRLVATDSGGLQKEAYFFKKPCLILREQTEWVELIQAGTHLMPGIRPEKILDHALNLLSIPADFSRDLYGNGMAGRAVVDTLAGLQAGL